MTLEMIPLTITHFTTLLSFNEVLTTVLLFKISLQFQPTKGRSTLQYFARSKSLASSKLFPSFLVLQPQSLQLQFQQLWTPQHIGFCPFGSTCKGPFCVKTYFSAYVSNVHSFLHSIKYSRASSSVTWLNGKQTTVSRTTSILIIRELTSSIQNLSTS